MILNLYSYDISKPEKSRSSCSRLSPYISWGNLNIRTVYQYMLAAKKEKKNLRSINSMMSRLHWHCHFIQKLEDEPSIECDNMHPLYDGLRENDFNEEYFQAWKEGQTGYPMVDACMRALRKTGWINFRMRAMLMSFSSYHLWLHWRKPALHLAQLFTDYEKVKK